MTSLRTRATPEQLYRLLADNATDVITLLDGQGRHLYVSPSVTALAGYDPEEIVGADGWSLIHPADLPHLQLGLQTAASAARVVTLEYRVRHADGHYEQRATSLCPAAVDALDAAAHGTAPWTADLRAPSRAKPPVRAH